MRKTLILSALGLAVLLVGSSCKKKKDEVITDSNDSPSVTVTADWQNTFSANGLTTAPASYYYVLSATASDKDGSIAKVEFYVNDVKVSEDLTAPYESSGYTMATENDIFAIATDNDGSTTKSAVVSLNVVF